MKNFYALLFLLSCLGAMAQSEIEPSKTGKKEPPLNYPVVDVVAIVDGCQELKESGNETLKKCLQEEMIRFVAKNFKYPKSAVARKVGAKIYVSFVIEKDASIGNIELVKSATEAYKDASREDQKAAKDLDKEAIRVVQKLKIDFPATQRGKPVPMSVTLPINIKLN